MSGKFEQGREVQNYISAAFHRGNVADLGGDEELNAIVAAGPRGAVVLAGLSLALLLAL